LYKETSIQLTEFTWPLLYHDDANRRSIKANGLVF